MRKKREGDAMEQKILHKKYEENHPMPTVPSKIRRGRMQESERVWKEKEEALERQAA